MSAEFTMLGFSFVFLFMAYLMHKREQHSYFYFFFALAFINLIPTSGALTVYFNNTDTYNVSGANFGIAQTGMTVFAMIIFMMIVLIAWGLNWYNHRNRVV